MLEFVDKAPLRLERARVLGWWVRYKWSYRWYDHKNGVWRDCPGDDDVGYERRHDYRREHARQLCRCFQFIRKLVDKELVSSSERTRPTRRWVVSGL